MAERSIHPAHRDRRDLPSDTANAGAEPALARQPAAINRRRLNRPWGWYRAVFGFMFVAGLKGPLIVAALTLLGTAWWMLSGGLSDDEAYLVWMRCCAAIYAFMEFDPAKELALETAFGGTVQIPMNEVASFPPMARAWAHTVDLLQAALARSALFLVPGFVLFYGFAAHFGSHSKERKHERGALLVTLPELVAELAAHNAGERARELREALGWKWRLTLPGERARVFPYSPSHLAGVVYPWRLEHSHAMLIGTTGMGKTVAMSDMVAEARSRRQRAVIFDLTGAFIEQFYDGTCDVIMNPLDALLPGRDNPIHETRSYQAHGTASGSSRLMGRSMRDTSLQQIGFPNEPYAWPGKQEQEHGRHPEP